MWPAHQTKANQDCGWNSCHIGITPVGRCHVLSQQIQGEGFPLRGESDLRLLGPHRRPLLPRRVGSDIISWNPSRCWQTEAGLDRWLWTLCFRSQTKERRFSVTLGNNALNESDPTEQTFRVEKVIVHEGFDNSEGNFDNDIGTNTSLEKLWITCVWSRCFQEV